MKKMLLLMCTVLVFACVVQAAQMRKGPYLFYPGDNTEMTVLWQLYETVGCELEWGMDETYSQGSVTSNEYGEDHQHKIKIPGLVPGSKYYYQVVAGEDVYVGSFLAAPAESATSLKFLAYGDTRSYPEDHNRVCSAMADAFEADGGYQTLTLLSGDWVGSGTNEEDWDVEYFGDGGTYLDTIYMQANLAINGCVGNHEARGQTLYGKYWPYPYVDGFYWSFDYGPALFVIVDQYGATRLSDKGPQRQLKWLKNVLMNSDKQWKFIVLHEPGYSAGGGHENNEIVQQLVQPLCEEYGVDIVFGGHNHYYARCDVPYAEGEGLVYHLTVGGGGAPLREPEEPTEPDDPDYPYLEFSKMTHHFCTVEIDGDTLNFAAVDPNGVVFDSLTIEH
jgi:hypothetical protein